VGTGSTNRRQDPKRARRFDPSRFQAHPENAMSSLALCLLLAQMPAQPARQGPQELRTQIEEVTVFPQLALVRRVGLAPGGGGELAVLGLPWAMDPTTVRVRCVGGDVLGMETRERYVDAVPNERVQELRERLKALQRERRGLEDERSLADDLKGHLQRLLQLEAQSHADEVQRGSANPDAWSKNLAYVSEQLAAVRKTLREVEWKIEELDVRIADVQADLGRSQQAEQIPVRDVHLEVLGRAGEPPRVEIEYLVANAGWRPRYDLRAAQDARSVELAYRAEVWQRSGEDWLDVELLLSTARPNLGAQGPEPQPIWLGLVEPGARKSGQMRELGYAAGDDAFAAGEVAGTPVAVGRAPFATVEDAGLSVRFRLPTRETVESRDDLSTVLIGQEQLVARPEYYVVPSLDTNVWLRGVATNSSQWTLLPGRAAVFFGTDFVGDSALELVQPGQELTLHLGADPALTVERKQLEDETEGPGLFGSRASQTREWLIKLENHGAAAVEPDGSATVYVQEALPRSTNEKLQIELAESKPKPADAERWKGLRDEDGILTWVLRVPKEGGVELRYTVRMSYPQGAVVAQ
jgi:uncharacterized protein (TIGR02231 family)